MNVDRHKTDAPNRTGHTSRIERVEIMKVDLPAKLPRKDAIQPFEKQETPLVRLYSSSGFVGTGYAYTLGTGGSAVCKLIADDLASVLIGLEAAYVEENWLRLKRSTNANTPGAISSLALAALDIALWDLKCQEAGLPLHIAAGGAQRRLPIYDTEGGWLNLPTEKVVENARLAQARGFRGFKLKVGRPFRDDSRRLAAVRHALGDEMELMTDANQIFSLDEALRRTRQHEELDVAWFEEPLPADDVSGHATLARATTVPIAIGETIYSIRQFREYLQAGACSIVQVDAARIGGITPWLKVAHMAEAFNLCVCPHYLMELHVSLAASVPNARWVEHIPQLDALLESGMRVDSEGFAIPPDAPGVGIQWDWPEIRRRVEKTGASVTIAQ